MVLEDITKEVNDAESNAENQKNSLSGGTILGKASDRQSAVSLDIVFLLKNFFSIARRKAVLTPMTLRWCLWRQPFQGDERV